jgi:hypothetical protein
MSSAIVRTRGAPKKTSISIGQVKKLTAQRLRELPGNDKFNGLSDSLLVAMHLQCGVTSADELLARSDSDILALGRTLIGEGSKSISELADWLATQRQERGEMVSTSVQEKVLEHRAVEDLRQSLSASVRASIVNSKLTEEEIAAAAGTTPDAVRRILGGGIIQSLELGVRLAAAVGLRVVVNLVEEPARAEFSGKAQVARLNRQISK